MAEAYIHGFSDWEQNRLVDQARVLAPQVFAGLAFQDVDTVLEIGCAVGAELRLLRELWPRLVLTGVDRNRAQILAARSMMAADIACGSVRLICADACSLPFPDRSFDRVLTIWTLEHIPNPEVAIRESLRLLTDTGLLIMTEVDNDTFRFTPGCQAIAEWWRQFNLCQQDAGGDPYIGQSLSSIACRAGAGQVTGEVLPIIDSRRFPHRRIVFLDYLESLLRSGADAMKAGGYADPQLEDAMRADFVRARSTPSIQFQYHAIRVTCTSS